MDCIMNFITNLATGITIGTGALSLIQHRNGEINEKRLKELPNGIFDYDSIPEDFVCYVEEVDEYISKCHSESRSVLSESDRKRFIDAFYESHTEFCPNKDVIDQYLNEYLNKLSKLLNYSFTTGEKFLGKKVNDIRCMLDNIEKKIDNVGNDVNGILIISRENKNLLENINEKIDSIKKQDKKQLLDQFTLVDNAFVKENITSDLEKCREAFFNAFGSTFSAIINGVIEKPVQYEEICQDIYDKSKTSPVTFLMAEIGTGKSTILCDVALRVAHDGYRVYWTDKAIVGIDGLDYGELENCDEETFIFVDNALDNASFLEKLYIDYKTSPCVHIILSDRTEHINTLISELTAPYCIMNGIAFVLNNRRSEKTVVSSLKPNNIIRIELFDDFRRVISHAAIESIIDYNSIDKSLAEEIERNLKYSDRSITDIIIDFCNNYNKNADESIHYHKKIKNDWEIWDEVDELKGTFRYLAALIKYGVKVPVRQLEKVADCSIEQFGKLIDEGKITVVNIDQNRNVILRHDSVADNYFSVPTNDAFDTIKTMIDKNLFVDEVLIEFERKVFSLSNIYSPTDEIESFKINRLVTAFDRSEDIKRVLCLYHRIHSLELAKLSINKSYTKIGDSYQRIKENYSNQEFLWIKYFFYVIRIEVDIPKEMLENLKENGLFKKITKDLNDYIFRNFRNFDKEEKKKWLIYCKKLFQWIIKNINRQDIPSRILLLRIYQEEREIEKAYEILNELNHMPDSLKKNSELSIAYLQTFEIAVKQLVKKDRKDQRIREINRKIRSIYESLIKRTERGTDEYIIIISRFIRFQKDTGHYDEAYDFAVKSVYETNEIAPHVSVYRIYIELGMICQNPNRRNFHSDNYEAIKWFTKARESIEETSRDSLYALKPLCKSYLYVSNYGECLNICESIRKIDPKDKEIDVIECEALRLKRAKELNLPKGNKYGREDVIKPDKVECAIQELLSSMTDEQMIYARLFDLENYKERDFAYRAIYCIKNNMFIPYRILSRLQVSDKETLQMMLDIRDI